MGYKFSSHALEGKNIFALIAGVLLGAINQCKNKSTEKVWKIKNLYSEIETPRLSGYPHPLFKLMPILIDILGPFVNNVSQLG